MEMNVLHDSKIVEIYLTKAEKNDPKLKESLKSVYSEYKKQKYMVVVYESGDKDLYQSTLDLLAYNKKRIPQLQVRKEREANPDYPKGKELLDLLRAPLLPATPGKAVGLDQ